MVLIKGSTILSFHLITKMKNAILLYSDCVDIQVHHWDPAVCPIYNPGVPI